MSSQDEIKALVSRENTACLERKGTLAVSCNPWATPLWGSILGFGLRLEKLKCREFAQVVSGKVSQSSLPESKVCALSSVPLIIKRWLPLESPPGLAKTPIVDFIPRVSQSVNVGHDVAFITRSQVLPVLLGQVITLWEPLPYALGIPQVCSTDLTWELVRTAESQAPTPVSPNLYFDKIFR